MLDWLSLARLNTRIPLDIDRSPTGVRSLLWQAAGAHLAASGRRVLTFVSEENSQMTCLGQAVVRDATWHVARLLTSSSLPPAEATNALAQLLGALAQAVAERGASRLYARVASDAAANEAFVRASFTPYTYESVYLLPKSPVQKPAPSSLPLRPQEGKDAWGIYQVYCSVTPRLVQQAEGLDSSAWAIPPTASVRGLEKMSELRWVLEGNNNEIVGYMRANRLGRRLHLLLAPQAYRYAQPMIALAIAEMMPIHYVRCCVPEYQGEVGKALEAEGFRYVGTQAVLIRQLSAPVRAENRVIRPVLEATLEPARTVSGQ